MILYEVQGEFPPRLLEMLVGRFYYLELNCVFINECDIGYVDVKLIASSSILIM